jgi:hypothetical protein
MHNPRKVPKRTPMAYPAAIRDSLATALIYYFGYGVTETETQCQIHIPPPAD